MFQKQIVREDWYLLKSFEKNYLKPLASRVPRSIETYHLTLLSLLWSGSVILFGNLALQSTQWLWGVSACILLQYITDVLDGEVGRLRSTGLMRWGFYMDHFLDFIFLSCLFFGYYLFLNQERDIIFLLYILITSFMIHAILRFPITEKFNFSFYGVGSSEIRVLAIILNTFVIFFSQNIIAPMLYIVSILLFISLCHTVYTTQKLIWKLDMNSRGK